MLICLQHLSWPHVGYPALPLSATTGTPEVRPSQSSRTREKNRSSLLRPQQIGTDLSHDGLNPAHVPLSLANSQTLGSFSTPRMR